MIKRVEFNVLSKLCVVFCFIKRRNWFFIWLRSCFSSWSWRKCCSWTLLLRCWVWTLLECHGVRCWVFWWCFWVCLFLIKIIFCFWYFIRESFRRYFWVYCFIVKAVDYEERWVRVCFHRHFLGRRYRYGTFEWVWVWVVKITVSSVWFVVGVVPSSSVTKVAMTIKAQYFLCR